MFSYFKKSKIIIKKYGVTGFFRKIRFYLIRKFNKKPEPHFVQEYQNYVNSLLKVYPRDEAMSMIAGGSYIETGNLQKEILLYYGLKPNMSIIDFGCGSGCLAHALPADYNLDYLGIDVIEELLIYARSKSPKNYKFNIHKKLLTIPVKSENIDIICAFNLFPLLLHEEIYIYLEDMKRALKKSGKVIFSFLEFDSPQHWLAFNDSANDRKKKKSIHLNTFIEKPVLKLWADKIGFNIIEFIDGNDKKFNGKNLGQSLAVFEKIS
jgi:ubiquinone/menaquinone biosynthesis C-methylase UbiE